MSRRGIHQVKAAYHLCNPLQMVVNNDSQLVCDQAIFSQNDEITGVTLQSVRLLALNQVDKSNLGVIATDPQGRFCRARAISAGAGVDGARSTSWDVHEVTARTTALVGRAGGQQLLNCYFVLCPRRALVVNSAIPVKSIGLQGGQNVLGRAWLLSGRVYVLNSNQPTALLRARLQVARCRGNERAEMQWARRRGCKSPDVTGCCRRLLTGIDRPDL